MVCINNNYDKIIIGLVSFKLFSCFCFSSKRNVMRVRVRVRVLLLRILFCFLAIQFNRIYFVKHFHFGQVSNIEKHHLTVADTKFKNKKLHTMNKHIQQINGKTTCLAIVAPYLYIYKWFLNHLNFSNKDTKLLVEPLNLCSSKYIFVAWGNFNNSHSIAFFFAKI